MMIKFNLNVSIEAAKLCKQDSLFVVGSAPFLGSWHLSKAIEMKVKHDDNLSICSATSNTSLCSAENGPELYSLDFEAFVNVNDVTEICENDYIYYKYFIAQKTSQAGRVFLKQVENGWRQMSVDFTSIMLISDKWPYYQGDGEHRPARVDLGWLLKDENEIQFHFFANPLQLWNVEEENKKYYAIEFKPMMAKGLIELKDYTLSHLDFNEQEYQNGKMNKFNAFNNPNVYSSFRFRSFEQPTNIIFQINIYELKDNEKVSDKLVATTYYKVNKSLRENCLIDHDLSLLKDQMVVGSLKTEICMIASIREDDDNSSDILEQSYSVKENFRYDFSRSCLSIGHRGMGKTFDGTLDEINFIENSIESFNEAFMRGADMVEFDIVLTKDNIPIIYHDFQFCITNNAADELNLNKYIDIAVNQMTYNEIKKSKIYAHCVRSSPRVNACTSTSMFPTLKEMCEQLDTNLGFNVEIKYPQNIEDQSSKTEIGRYLKWLNRNDYADVILKELYRWVSDSRLVILSTFDPLLCSILRIKQNKFPVLFLTTGITAKWIPFQDFRCKNTKISVNYAKSEGIHGIVAHTEEISGDSQLMNDLFIGSDPRTTNFLRIAWGEELNEQNKRKLYKKTGLNGIIYDRIQITDKNEETEEVVAEEIVTEEVVKGSLQSLVEQVQQISVLS